MKCKFTKIKPLVKNPYIQEAQSGGPYGFPGMRNEAFSSQIKWGNIMVIRRFLGNFAPWGDKVFYIP